MEMQRRMFESQLATVFEKRRRIEAQDRAQSRLDRSTELEARLAYAHFHFQPHRYM